MNIKVQEELMNYPNFLKEMLTTQLEQIQVQG